jgi:hypothetical protein
MTSHHAPTIRRTALPPRGGWRFACAVLGAVLVIVVVAATASAQSSSDEVYVVVNRRNPAASVSREFLTDAFLKRASRWDGGEMIRPVDQRADAASRRLFSSGILRRPVRAVQNYWQQHIFAGGALPPPELDSNEAVVRYVEKYPGAVGYVSNPTNLGETKVIGVQ